MPDALEVFEQGRLSGGAYTGNSIQRRTFQVSRLLLPVAAQQALSEVGSALHGDEESVCKAISLAILELEQCAAEWDKQRPETEKRTAALWLSGAALLVILLI